MIIKIWYVRSKKGISLRRLEELTGISKSEINLIEREDNKRSPTLDQLEKIAIALDVRITDLFDSEYK